MVSFDLISHDLGDGPPLEADDEDAIVLGNSGVYMFDKSPQQDEIGGVGLVSVRRNEKTSESNGDWVLDESPQCDETHVIFQYSFTQLQWFQNIDASFHVYEIDDNGPIVKEELGSISEPDTKTIFSELSMCRIDGEGEFKIGSLVELQSTTEMEEESSEKNRFALR